MWNYSLVVPSIMMMTTLLCFFFARRRLPIRINRTFLGLLALHMWVEVFDLLSTRADENYMAYSTGMLYMLNGAFFVLFVARIFWFYRMTLDALGIRQPSRWTRLSALPCLVTEAVCLSCPLTGAVFSIGEGGYIRGPVYNILYACFAFYLILSVILIICRAGTVRRSVVAAGLAYNLTLVASNVTRFMLPRVLVMNTFCMVAILIVYLAFLNPDLYLSEIGPAFNMRGFRLLLMELSQRRKYRVLGFVLQNYNHERSILGGDQMDLGLAQIMQYLIKTFPLMTPFYLRGGRFALICADADAQEDARRRIDARFDQPWRIGAAELYLNIAFASVNAESNLGSADRSINNLVLAMDGARRSAGKLDVQEMDSQVDILYSLERALEEGRVEVFLQPVVDGPTRGIVAAEALARLRDDGGKIIPPGLFIPIAERSGYINQLGEQVFEKTCAFIRDHDLEGLGLQWINVNLSPIQCMQKDLGERFDEILRRYGVDARYIHLEITEQSMVDYTYLQQQMEKLRAQGFSFVLDDFGSGYSNLTRVMHYPFVNIKIDMELVWDYFRDRDSLLPNLIEGFKRLNFSITAEGIETAEMADILTEIGSDYLQGYLFSKPLPLDEFVQKYGNAPS